MNHHYKNTRSLAGCWKTVTLIRSWFFKKNSHQTNTEMRSLILCGFALICVVGGAPQVKWQKNSFLFNRNYPCVVHSLYSNASVNLYMLSPVFIGVIEFMNNAELIKDAVLYVHVCPNCQLLFPCVKWWRWLIVTNHGTSYSSVDTVTFFYFVAYITHTWLRKRKRFFGEAYIWR